MIAGDDISTRHSISGPESWWWVYSNGNESLPSNLAGVLGTETVAGIFAQTNRDAGTSGWADAFPVRTLTNPPGTLFYRLRISSTQTTLKYP